MTQPGLRLFERPLQRDPLLRLWGAALLLVALISLVRNVDVGASYNPDRAVGFLTDVAAGALLSFLLLCWFPALVRWVWRYGNAYPLPSTHSRAPSWRPGDPSHLRKSGAPFDGRRAQSPWTGARSRRARWGPFADAHAARRRSSEYEGVRELDPEQPLGAGASSWTTAAPRRSTLGDVRLGHLRWLEPDPEEAPPAPASGFGRVPDVLLSVDTLATVPGVPVEVSWRADGAEYVTIEGVDQRLPAQGTLAVHLDGSRDVIVTAHNEHGSTSTRTEIIRVLPVPVLHAVHFPAMGEVSVNADVRVGVDWGDPVMQRMDAVLATQERLRTERFTAPPQPVVPVAVLDAVRGLSRLVETTRSWRVGETAAPAAVLPTSGRGLLARLLARLRRVWFVLQSLFVAARRHVRVSPACGPSVVASSRDDQHLSVKDRMTS